MSSKIFLQDKNGLAIVGDSRDVLLPSEIRKQVWDWCFAKNITLEGVLYGTLGHDLWRIRDTQDRVLFVLKWA